MADSGTDAGMKVWDLTPLTRGAATERTTILFTVEVPLRYLRALLFATPLSLPFTALAWMTLGKTAAVVCLVLCLAGFAWLIEGRRSRGLELRNWKALYQKANNNNRKFFISGEQYDPLAMPLRVVRTRALPVTPSGENPTAEQLLMTAPPPGAPARHRHRSVPRTDTDIEVPPAW